MDKFVCLRMIQMNGVELDQFQFDYDMSFGVFFLNPDGAVYGRYGTRNERPDNADSQISMEGLRAAMQSALALHKGYPENRDSLAGKKGPKPKYSRAELYPQMAKYSPKINYNNQVAKSCIHCHQVHNAERQMLRDARQPIPDEILYLYPMPQVVGIEFDPRQRAKIQAITNGSPAASAGLKPGDEILFANKQPLVSIADFQWVLQNQSGTEGSIPLKVLRAGKTGDLSLNLENGWRKKTDFSWRVSTWDLRRMALGGASLQVDTSSRKTEMGLEVKAVGKFGQHAVAKNAGVKAGDKIKSIAGLAAPSSEAAAIAHVLSTTRKGDTIKFVVMRGGKEVEIAIRTQ